MDSWINMQTIYNDVWLSSKQTIMPCRKTRRCLAFTCKYAETGEDLAAAVRCAPLMRSSPNCGVPWIHTPLRNYHDNGKTPIWRCNSYFKNMMIFQPAMLVDWRINANHLNANHFFMRYSWGESDTTTKWHTGTFLSDHPASSNSGQHTRYSFNLNRNWNWF